MTYANMSCCTKENSFSGQVKVGDSEPVIGLVHQYHECTWNHGSQSKIMTHANMSDRAKENNFSGQIKVRDSKSVVVLTHRHHKSNTENNNKATLTTRIQNHGSYPKIMAHTSMSYRTKKNSFSGKSRSEIPNLLLF